MNDGIYGFEYCCFENPRYYTTIGGKQFDAIYVKKCEILDRLSVKAEVILREGTSKIEALATRLLEKNELSSVEIRKTLDAE